MGIKVVITSDKDVYGLTLEQADKIKADLTLPNPAYAQVKKYSKWGNTKVPKYLFYYAQNRGYLTVPCGYQVPYEAEVIDNRIEHTVAYPLFKLELRGTQREAFKHYLDDTDKGVIVLPTGKGKSILGLYIAYKLRQKTLVIVHKDDLASGWKEDANLCFDKALKTGLLKAQKKTVGEQVTIAMIQTLNRMSKEELEALYNEFGCIIIDEAHHCPSGSYDLLNKFNATYKIGLTATDERSDGLRNLMQYHLGDVAFRYEADENDEDILPVTVKVLNSSVKYMPQVEVSKGVQMPITSIPYDQRPRIDYHEIDEKVVLDPKYMEQVSTYLSREYLKDRSCVVFFSQKEHIREYHRFLTESWCDPDHIQMYYGDATESKEEMKRKAESKEVYITLATYSIATEGTNVKQWEVCFLVSSINNEKNTEQAVGRIRRSKKGKINPVIVYDFRHPNVYIVCNHGFTRDRRYKKLGFKIEVDRPKGLVFTRGARR